MELTVDAALSTGAMLGHLSYLLLIASMLTTRMVLLRILVIVSAFPALAYGVFWLRDPVGLFWETLLVTVNTVQLARTFAADRRARLSAEEAEFVSHRLRLLSHGTGRRLLDTGDWVELPAGTVLTEEGRRPEALWYVVSGDVEIRHRGLPLGRCAPGSFVGEMALMEPDAPASATATTAGPVRAWRLPYEKLQRLPRVQPDAWEALHAAMARDMRLKLIERNGAVSGA